MVVTTKCTKHLRKTTVKALIKTFNSKKPRDVMNWPNGTKATMVKWWGDRNSPTPLKRELNLSVLSRVKHHT